MLVSTNSNRYSIIQVNERLSFLALKLGLRFVLPKEDKESKRGKGSVLGT